MKFGDSIHGFFLSTKWSQPMQPGYREVTNDDDVAAVEEGYSIPYEEPEGSTATYEEYSDPFQSAYEEYTEVRR